MGIDWRNFTPVSAIIGGVLIGLESVLLALFNGCIAGVSGVMGGLVPAQRGDRAWRLMLILGLILAGASANYVYAITPLAPLAGVTTPPSPIYLTLSAGFLVGIGTRYAAGCTSGHGVCGISRWSLRSLLATVLFMSAGFATVYVARHMLQLI